MALMFGAREAKADGFSLERSLQNEPHITLELTPQQVALVGRERKLILNAPQKALLSKHVRKVPKVLGVESLGEPDCSCHISSAMWTATSQVTIWTRRLGYDTNGSKFYYEIRLKRGFYTANAQGEIFAGGKPVTWSAFEAAVMAKTDKDHVRLSRPPIEPEAFTTRVEKLRAKKPFFSRL